ncbi:hypothetical protein [Bacillus manliponensis]|uniref:hypothetical protein n=1 Tax=Bacillus manliponensis TaxID=574376 RepID=UPI003518766C
MKNYFTRVGFALIAMGIYFWMAHFLQFDANPSYQSYFFPIALIGGWGGWYLYKFVKKKLGKGKFLCLAFFIKT